MMACDRFRRSAWTSINKAARTHLDLAQPHAELPRPLQGPVGSVQPGRHRPHVYDGKGQHRVQKLGGLLAYAARA